MSTELVSYQPPQEAVIASLDFMPVFDMQRAIQRRNMLVQFTQQIMVKDIDYGSPAGTGKPSLLKAGAEKLCTFFGLVPEFTITEQVEDWTGRDHKGEPFFYYRYKCRLSRSNRSIGEGEGSCNTWESKYRYRWVSESWAALNGFDTKHLTKRGGSISEFVFAVNKSETSGKYGKPAEYWQAFKDAIENGTARKIKREQRNGKQDDAWEIDATECRVPNPDVADQVNTCQKMAQKRALVAAVLIAVNASEYFTQDVEDLDTIDLPRVRVADLASNGYHDEPPPQQSAETKTASQEQEPPEWVEKPHAKPAPAVQQSFAPDTPAKLVTIYTQLQGPKKYEVFDNLLLELTEVCGEFDGNDAYSEILRKHGAASCRDLRLLSKAKAAAKDLFEWIENAKAEKAKREEVTLEDVPA